MRALAKRYAKALVTFSVEKNMDLEKTYSYLCSIKSILEENPKLFTFFVSPIVPNKDKLDAAKDFIYKVDLPDYIRNFFLLVVEKERLKIFGEIVEEFRKLADEVLGQVRGKLKVAYDIDRSDVDELKAEFEKILGKKVVLDVEKDPEIIGGAVAIIGSTVFDGSVVGSLRQIKEKLIEG